MRNRLGTVLLPFLLGCQEDGFSSNSSTLPSHETEFFEAPREVQLASLELRSALALDADSAYFSERLDVLEEAEIAWFRTRLIAHFDKVHAMSVSHRSEAAQSGQIAPMVMGDLVQIRALVLAEPAVETEIRPGGVPDTVGRLLEHSRIRVRVAMAELDSRVLDMEARLGRPAELTSDGHLSLVETDMVELTDRAVQIHMLRLELLPWIFQFQTEAATMELLSDPAVQGWFFTEASDPELD